MARDAACQARVRPESAQLLGIPAKTPVSYRAGDQPNNALSLNVLQPGEVAATAGTSGVVYGVGEKAAYDPESRVNTFVPVNHTPEAPRYGTLLCVNGTAMLNSWLRRNATGAEDRAPSYDEMNALAAAVPPGCEGLVVLPYGNGAERLLGNRNPGASVHFLDFNRHTRAHLLRSAQEGIVFALQNGLETMRAMGLTIEAFRAGAANMLLSSVFGGAVATVIGTPVELYDTDGSQGAARGAGIGAGLYDLQSAFSGLHTVRTILPNWRLAAAYTEAYGRWREALQRELTE